MKITLFTVPIVIAAFTLVAVWGLGMLAVKASAVSTQTNLELLRLNLRVARLNEELQKRSRESLAAQGALLQQRPGFPPRATGRRPLGGL